MTQYNGHTSEIDLQTHTYIVQYIYIFIFYFINRNTQTRRRPLSRREKNTQVQCESNLKRDEPGTVKAERYRDSNNITTKNIDTADYRKNCLARARDAVVIDVWTSF